MGIQALGQFGGFQNDYRIQNIKTVDVETVKQQDEQQKAQEASVSYYQPPQENAVNNNRIANLEDISLTFNKSDDFGYIGQDASLSGLDMEKAISDMKKDQVLEQYQYFVGSSQNVIKPEDGMVFMK